MTRIDEDVEETALTILVTTQLFERVEEQVAALCGRHEIIEDPTAKWEVRRRVVKRIAAELLETKLRPTEEEEADGS